MKRGSTMLGVMALALMTGSGLAATKARPPQAELFTNLLQCHRTVARCYNSTVII